MTLNHQNAQNLFLKMFVL